MKLEPKVDYFIAYDLGTGGIKASLFDENGTAVKDVFRQYETFYPADRFVEQRPKDWWEAVCHATKALIEKAGIQNTDIRAAALSGHSEVAVPFTASSEELCERVPIWCDMRAYREQEEFFSRTDYEGWYETTGNGDPAECYTIMKLMWYRKHCPELYERTAFILGSKDYINYRLTGVRATDPSYASSFGVFNLKAWRYEDAYFEIAGIPRQLFPEIVPSDAIVGRVTKAASLETGLSEGMPIACGAADNTCMALGSVGTKSGRIYTSLGSSAWIAINSEEPIVDIDTRPFVFAHVKKNLYTSAVSIFSAGNTFRWVRDTWLKDYGDSTDTYNIMNQMAESVPPGSHGVMMNPTLAGGSAQEPSPELKGSVIGLTLGTTREDLVRASMEGVAYALRSTLDILKKKTGISGEMLISGGGAKSRIWRRIFASIYQMPVLKTDIDQNAASLGAAALAMVAVGAVKDYDWIDRVHTNRELILPDETWSAYYMKMLPVYKEWTENLAGLAAKLKES